MSASSVITIAGTGAVSPAGWGVPALMAALEKGAPLPLIALPHRSGKARSNPARKVPPPAERMDFLTHPRLRRSSPITQYAAAAAHESLTSAGCPADARTGIICTVLNGCVGYTARFYGEVLADPAMASPILFPETVFNAPASHIAALLGTRAPAFTLPGDSAAFLPGIELAIGWLLNDTVDVCVVTGAEEVDWLTAEALGILAPGAVLSEGAGALCLTRGGSGPVIHEIAGPVSTGGPVSRAAAALAVRRAFAGLPREAILVDDATGCRRSDAASLAAWQDWTGPRLSPRRLLGEAPGASAALQCVIAAEHVRRGDHAHAIVCATGGAQASGVLVAPSQCAF